MAYVDQDDPFLQVQADVQSTLRQIRPLFSSYLRIRSLATSPTSPELQQSRSELLGILSTLSADLSDLIEAVSAVEHDPYRFGLDVVEVARRREFVRDVGGEVESMRRELEGGVEHGTVGGVAGGAVGRVGGSGRLPDPSSFNVGGGVGGDEDGNDDHHDDPYGEFEHREQMQIMQEQDEQLEGVSRTVGNLRIQAQDVGRELEEQAGMLDEVDKLTNRVGGRLQSGAKKLGYIMRRNEDTMSSCCIAVLIFVLILLLFLVIVL